MLSNYPIIEELLEQLLCSLFGLNKDKSGRSESALNLMKLSIWFYPDRCWDKVNLVASGLIFT